MLSNNFGNSQFQLPVAYQAEDVRALVQNHVATAAVEKDPQAAVARREKDRVQNREYAVEGLIKIIRQSLIGLINLIRLYCVFVFKFLFCFISLKGNLLLINKFLSLFGNMRLRQKRALCS